jgi:nitrite reductase/ring-hydroxylating ferredoxin subunit
MRRHDKLVEISRRDFCVAAGCVAAVAACTDGTGRPVQTGQLGETPDAPQGDPDAAPDQPDAMPGAPDAKPGSPDARPADANTSQPDASSGGPTCSGTVTDCGAPPSSFTSTPKLISSKFFVVRDSGGLYAVSAKCTHEGATLTNDGSEFYCPRHGATFDYSGNVLGGPVFTGLVHYSMCITSTGNVGVNTSQSVSQSTRMNA